MNKVFGISATLVAAMAIGANITLAVDLEKPAANLTERWVAGSNGWATVDPVGVSGWSNGVMAIKCNQTIGDGFTKQLRLKAVPGASADIFFGNCSRMDAVAFDFQSFDMAATPYFYFMSTDSGRRWKIPLLDGTVNGQACVKTLPLVYSTSWTTAGVVKPEWASWFEADKTNIYEIGFMFDRAPNNTNTQFFVVDNLKLVGPWGGPYSNGVPLAWVLENGLTNDFGSAGLEDNDKDSYSNAAEFLAGTNPEDPTSFFKIDIVRNASGKLVVRWNGNTHVNYDLQESTAMNGVFETKTNIAPLSVKTEEVSVDDSTAGAKFYKVTIKSSN